MLQTTTILYNKSLKSKLLFHYWIVYVNYNDITAVVYSNYKTLKLSCCNSVNYYFVFIHICAENG